MKELAKLIEIIGNELLPSQTDTYNSLTEDAREEAFMMDKDTAYDYVRRLPRRYLPRSPRNREASNSEIRRWLENHSIEINGECLGPNELITYPISSLVFFPKGNRCTML